LLYRLVDKSIKLQVTKVSTTPVSSLTHQAVSTRHWYGC